MYIIFFLKKCCFSNEKNYNKKLIVSNALWVKTNKQTQIGVSQGAQSLGVKGRLSFRTCHPGEVHKLPPQPPSAPPSDECVSFSPRLLSPAWLNAFICSPKPASYSRKREAISKFDLSGVSDRQTETREIFFVCVEGVGERIIIIFLKKLTRERNELKI